VEARSIAVRIERRVGTPAAGTVVLENKGSADLVVWRAGNAWGDEVLSFDAAWDVEGSERIVRKPQVYTVNVPASVAVPPGGQHEIPFALTDGSWEPDPAVARLAGAGADLTAVYDVPASHESAAYGVWTGRVRSDPVRFGPDDSPA